MAQEISLAQVDNLVALLDGYVEKGGHHLNVNVFTKETNNTIPVCRKLCKTLTVSKNQSVWLET